jgi:hypothetical protein
VRRRQFALVVEAEPTGNEDILIGNFACAEDHNPCFHLVERMADSVLPSPFQTRHEGSFLMVTPTRFTAQAACRPRPWNG